VRFPWRLAPAPLVWWQTSFDCAEPGRLALRGAGLYPWSARLRLSQMTPESGASCGVLDTRGGEE
jgi:hypothetical protein